LLTFDLHIVTVIGDLTNQLDDYLVIFGDTKIFTIDPTIAHYGTSLFYLLCIVASVFNKNWVILLMRLILSFTVFFVNAHFSQGYTGKNLHLDENGILTDSFVFK